MTEGTLFPVKTLTSHSLFPHEILYGSFTISTRNTNSFSVLFRIKASIIVIAIPLLLVLLQNLPILLQNLPIILHVFDVAGCNDFCRRLYN